MVRNIDVKQISDAVRELFIEANYKLPCDILSAIKNSKNTESSPIGAYVLADLISNVDAAEEICVPIGQDTGMAVVF